jgi:hypothetical protein
VRSLGHVRPVGCTQRSQLRSRQPGGWSGKDVVLASSAQTLQRPTPMRGRDGSRADHEFQDCPEGKLRLGVDGRADPVLPSRQ